MKIVKLTKEKDTTLVRQLYESAFPPEEKKPFSLILKKSDEGSMEILSIEEDDGSFLGLAIFILYKELALLDYFAISPERRGGGVGT
ncbi:MAG: GNAT family N-acetyltransferase, partial [Clostridia bacterium]|nr:GNAT family N-acetyltransferase [Clostridia bacterium]